MNGLRSPATIMSADEGLPPPYSEGATETPVTIGSPTDTALSASSRHRSLSLSSSSTVSNAQGVRIRTKGDDLKSGFPYHPQLFDLRVRPDDWQRFSDQVTDATKFDSSDYAKMWAAAGSVALTGRILTTAWVGRCVLRCDTYEKLY